MQTPAARNLANRYNFRGKETQIATGYIDLSKRFFDPAVGRFMQVDPLTTEQENQSVYQYGWNNPVLMTDPDGMAPVYGQEAMENFTQVQEEQKKRDEKGGKGPTSDGGRRSEALQAAYNNPGFFEGGGPVHMAFTTMNELNPIAIGVNSIKAYFTGTNVNGEVMSGTEATFNLATMLPVGKLGKVGKMGLSVIKNGAGIWSSTKSLSAVENAFAHFKKHGTEFPEFLNAKQYVEGAKAFLNSPPLQTLVKTRANGDILKYHPNSNTFGVMDASGAPKTMFRPTDGMNYWLNQK